MRDVPARVALDLSSYGRNRKGEGEKRKELTGMIFLVFCSTVKQRNLEPTVLTGISCFDKGIYTVKSWELFKMPVSIIAVL